MRVASFLCVAVAASSVTAFVPSGPSSRWINQHLASVTLPSSSSSSTPTGSRGRIVMFSDQAKKLNDQVAKLRAEAEKLEKELAAKMPAPVKTDTATAAPVARAWTFEQLKTELSKSLSGSGAIDGKLKELKEQGALSKYGSTSPKGFRRYSPDAFAQQTGIQPQEIESGGSQDDLKSALGVVLAASTIAVFGGIAIGGFAGTFLVYIFLLIPILFIGIGSSSPGLISVLIVLVNNVLDGKGKERRITHEAARILTGYILGLQIEGVTAGEEVTEVKFFDTQDGNFNQLGASQGPAGPAPRRKFTQEDIIPHSVLAISGSVAERLEFGKVIDRQNDFLYLLKLMDLVRPNLKAAQRNDHVIYAALQAYQILTRNKSTLERVKEKVAAKAPIADIIATIEA